MSVAFRRDSDEEHREPKFELPLPPGPNPVTTRGLALLDLKVRTLEATLKGDPAEPREVLERELRYWRRRLASAQLSPPPLGNVVAIGTRVTVAHKAGTECFAIVGHDEAEPSAGRIGWASPLAQALMGAEAGDEVELPGARGLAQIMSVTIADESGITSD